MSKALVMYMPVIHKTYLELIEETRPEAIFLVGNELAIKLLPYLKKDLRALMAGKVRGLLVGADPNPFVYVIDHSLANNLSELYSSFVLPNEDISHLFADKFLLNSSKVEFVDVFLRYDTIRTTDEIEPSPDSMVVDDEFSKYMMLVCKDLSKRSPDWWRQVGALVVKDEIIIDDLTSYNQSMPVPNNPYHVGDPRSNFSKGINANLTTAMHAEQAVISKAARLGIALEGADIYVSTFPCPWCAKAIALSGISRVFYQDGYSMLDGEEILRVNGVEIIRVVS
ncbi:MAG: deaminase [Candidatus Saccharibacteria bacterium]